MHYKNLILKADRDICDALDKSHGAACISTKNWFGIAVRAFAICYLKKADDITDAMMVEHGQASNAAAVKTNPYGMPHDSMHRG